MKDLKTRTLTGIFGIALLLFIVSKGKIYLSVAISLLSIIGLWEFYQAMNNIKIKPVKLIGYLAVMGLFISNQYHVINTEFVLYLIMISLLIMLLINKKIKVIDVAATLLGILYVPFFLFYIYRLDGSIYIWLIFLISFGTDTFAYFVGNAFGRNKLCPNISPNKTQEGALGGILGSLVVTLILGYFIKTEILWKLAILAILASITAQIGDLVASRIKRLAKIKDYGFIFPGHGGVLDRFDSIIFTAPLIYYYVEHILI